MKKTVKSAFVSLLILCLTIVSIGSVSVSAANPDDGIMPLYNNTSSATANISINDSGKLTITYKYNGYSGIATKAVITSYIEKKTLGLFWKRVDIGKTNNQWVDTVNNYKYTGSRTYQLSSTGTYRVTVIYNIYGSGGPADKIECKPTATY